VHAENVSAQLYRLNWLLRARVVEAKLRVLDRAVKAGFDPNQPRVPAGSGRTSGRWSDGGGVGSGQSGRLSPQEDQGAASTEEPLGDPPEIPSERPPTARARTRLIKEAARWLAKATLRQTLGRRIGTFVSILEVTGWLDTGIHYIHAFADPPKSLEELQQAVSTPAIGYDVHHVVEQTSAEQDGFPRAVIDSPENLVRIPTLKHWLITGWYMMKLETYGWRSPRNYLRGMSWEERTRIGLDALIKFGVLKP
jgi:hypothetical protein